VHARAGSVMLSMLITGAIGESRHGRIASFRHGDDLPCGGGNDVG